MSLGISIPNLKYKSGRATGIAAFGSDQIAASASKVTIDCGELGINDVVRIMPTATVASIPGAIFEIQKDNGYNVRNVGNQGQFVVGYHGCQQVNTITPSVAPATGDYCIDFDGQTTNAIAYDATAAAIKAELEQLTTIGVGNVLVTGTLASVVTITFSGTLLRKDCPPVTISSNTTAVTLTVADATTNTTNAIAFDWMVVRGK